MIGPDDARDLIAAALDQSPCGPGWVGRATHREVVDDVLREVRRIVADELDAADQDESVSLAARADRWRAER